MNKSKNKIPTILSLFTILLLFSFLFYGNTEGVVVASSNPIILAQLNWANPTSFVPQSNGYPSYNLTTGSNVLLNTPTNYNVAPIYPNLSNNGVNNSLLNTPISNGLQDWSIFNGTTGAYNPNPIAQPSTIGSGPVLTPAPQTAQTGPNESGNCGINVNSSTGWVYCMLTPVGGLLGNQTSDSAGKTEAVNIDDGLSAFIAKIYKLGIGIAIALAIVMISFGGIRMATTDSVAATDEGKKMINAAFAGLFLALFSYVLLYTINPALVGNGSSDFLNTKTQKPAVSGVDTSYSGAGGNF